jgi:hypothetical protein
MKANWRCITAYFCSKNHKEVSYIIAPSENLTNSATATMNPPTDTSTWQQIFNPEQTTTLDKLRDKLREPHSPSHFCLQCLAGAKLQLLKLLPNFSMAQLTPPKLPVSVPPLSKFSRA